MLKKIWDSSFGINALKKAASIVSGVLFLILMTRFLGPEKRGEYAYIMNWVNISATLFNLGISLVLANSKRNNPDFNVNNFYSLSVVQFLLYTACVLILWVFSGNEYLLLIGILSALSIFHLQLMNIGLIINLRIHSFSVIISSLVNLIAIIVVFVSVEEAKLYSVLAVVVLKELIAIIITTRLLNLRLVRPDHEWLSILRSGILPMVATGLIALNYKVDVLMLEGLDVGMYAVGLYATGVALAEYSWVVTDVFKEFMLFKNANEENKELMNRSIRVAFSLIVVIAVLFAIVGKWMLVVMFGESFLDSFGITLIALASVPFMVFVKIIGTLFIVRALWGTYILILSFTVLLNVAFNWIFIPKFGIEAAAVGSLISYGFCGIACLYWYLWDSNSTLRDTLIVNTSDLAILTRRFTKR